MSGRFRSPFFILLRALSETLLAVLLVFLFVSSVHAGAMTDRDRLMFMPRLMITGFVDGRYDDFYTKIGDISSHTYQFTEHLNLNAAGFIVDRRLLQYNVGVDYERSDGTASLTGDYKSVNLNLMFLPFRPLNGSLRASYSDGPGYDLKTVGFSVVYTRSVVPESAVKEFIKQQRQQRQQQPQQQQQQSNSEENTGGQGNTSQSAAANEAAMKAELKKYEKGFLYYFLPKIFNLDFDAYTANTGDSNTTSYSTRFAARGDYGKTNYTLSVSDVYQKSDSDSTNSLFSDLSTHTGWNRWSIMSLDNDAFFNKCGATSAYGLSSAVHGFLSRASTWDYSASAGYRATTDNGTSTDYGVSASTGSSSIWRKTFLNYRFTAGYNRTENSTAFENGYGIAVLGTNTPLSTKVSLGTSSSLTGGTNGSGYSFGIRANYTPLPRLFLYAAYSIQGAMTQNADNSALPDKGPLQTAEAGVSYYNRINLSSNIFVSWSPKTESDKWYTTASTRIWQLNVVLGSDLTRDKNRDTSDLGATEATGYSFFNTISGPFFFRNSSFTLSSVYTKNDSKNIFYGTKTTTESWNVNPFITWFWRRLIITADGRYTVTDATNSPRITDRRITLRVTRPFRLL